MQAQNSTAECPARPPPRATMSAVLAPRGAPAHCRRSSARAGLSHQRGKRRRKLGRGCRNTRQSVGRMTGTRCGLSVMGTEESRHRGGAARETQGPGLRQKTSKQSMPFVKKSLKISTCYKIANIRPVIFFSFCSSLHLLGYFPYGSQKRKDMYEDASGMRRLAYSRLIRSSSASTAEMVTAHSRCAVNAFGTDGCNMEQVAFNACVRLCVCVSLGGFGFYVGLFFLIKSIYQHIFCLWGQEL